MTGSKTSPDQSKLKAGLHKNDQAPPGMKVHPVGIRMTPLVALLYERSDGHAAFTLPAKRWMQDPRNHHIVKDGARIDRVCEKRSDTDAFSIKTDEPTKQNFFPPYLVTLSELKDNEECTARLRKELADRACIMWNCPQVQLEFGNSPGTRNPRHMLAVSADATPDNEEDWPRLSDIIPVGQAMEVIGCMYAREDTGDHLSDQEICGDDGLMEQFFAPELIPRVRAAYSEGGNPFGDFAAQHG